MSTAQETKEVAFDIRIIYTHLSSIERRYENQKIQVKCGNQIELGKWLFTSFVNYYKEAKKEYNLLMNIKERNAYITNEKPCKKAQLQAGQGRKNDKKRPLNLLFSVYSVTEHMYIYFSKCKTTIEKVMLPMEEIQNNKIFIKVRKTEEQIIQHEDIILKNPIAHQRPKERKILTIITKVYEWRNLYNSGINLNEAARIVGISKKSLDDYLLQLRYGKEHGFRFEDNKNQKVGELRKFIKKIKKQEAMRKDKFKIYEVPRTLSKGKKL